MRVALLAALIASSSAAAAGCAGTNGADRPERSATLLLDLQPNAVHAGIYLALERDFDGAEGVQLRARAPGASTDAVRLLASGRADMAILDIHDLALARQRGDDVVGVMAVVQRPLAAVLAQPSIRRPRDLEGRRVGVTGLPGARAVLDSVLRGDGADPERVRMVTIGSRAVSALLSRRVAGATALWNAEGVELRKRRPATREFRVEAFGAPAYPELVLSVARRTLTENRAVVRATVDALRRGYGDALTDPESAISALVQRNPRLDREAAQRGFDAVSPAFTAGARRFGELDRDRLGAWARWEVRFGVTERPPNVARAFEFGF